jgi:hypothetical protein
MSKFEDDFENTMKSKDALDIAHALKMYYELMQNGWPRDKAFQVAIMGVAVWHVPGLKPLPEPDPPFFSVSVLYEEVKKAHSHVTNLKRQIESDINFLKMFMEKHGTDRP